MTEKDYTQCKHYPWVLIDDDCPNCEKYSFDKASNTFYCLHCHEYTRHRVKYTKFLSCIACNNVRKIALLHNSGENQGQFLFVAPHGELVPFNKSLYKKCTNCDGTQSVEYWHAYFYCGIQGANGVCVDVNRPLCTRCHLRICNKKTHELCK
jgi:hypothetical protein